jgi:hypothetical protein
MPWASVGASVAGSAISGALGGSSAKKAANAVKRAMREANDQQMIARNEIKYDLRPYLNTGAQANDRLAELLGISSPKGYTPKPSREDVANEFSSEHYAKFGRGYSAKDSDMGGENNRIDAVYNQRLADWQKGLDAYQKSHPDENANNPMYGSLLKSFSNEDFVQDPGYEFRQQEGEKGINRSLAARGGYNSGAALKALDKYNQEYASNEFSNAYNRDAANKARTFSFLSGTAGQGLQAAGTKAGFLQQSANQQGANTMNAGTNQAQLGMQGASAWNDAIQGGIGNAIYAYERNKPVTGGGIGGGYDYGYSSPQSSSDKAWYLS